ncbi:hypothetical protein HG530_008831 [Fusarium avenaceum]|nr:hypothetical protein HG530_008831 [Fusarium avenaceum]
MWPVCRPGHPDAQSLDDALLLEVGKALSCQRTVDLHSVDESGDGDQTVRLHILVELLRGGLVEDDGVLGLVLDLALGPLEMPKMSDAGEIEVENSALYEVLPKDVVKEVGNVKLFNKWDYDVEVRDISLTDYISLRNPVYVTHTAGRYATKRFRKANCPIIERLTNSLMHHGRNNGKKLMAVRIVAHAFEIIHLMTDQNPIQVAVDAIVNCGPREDSTRIGSAGTVRRQAVDVSPLRRVNQAISLLTTGAREASFRNVKSIAECLAEELINAAKGSSNSYAIKKKDELERVAKSNR